MVENLIWKAVDEKNARLRLRRAIDADFHNRDRLKKQKWRQANKEYFEKKRKANKKWRQMFVWEAIESKTKRKRFKDIFNGVVFNKPGRQRQFTSRSECAKAYKAKLKERNYLRYIEKRRKEKNKYNQNKRLKKYGSINPVVSFGFQNDKPGFLYLCGRPDALKIGITNRKPLERVLDLDGFSLIESIYFVNGLDARNLETLLKRQLKKEGVYLGKEAWREPFDGYTETWPRVDLDVQSLKDLASKLSISVDIFSS